MGTSLGVGEPVRLPAAGIFAVVACVYLVINFVLVQNILIPLHQDDYLALGYDRSDFRLGTIRPVSMNLVYLMGALGSEFAFPMLIASAIIVAVLVLLFLREFLQVAIGVPTAILFSLVAFAHVSAFEHSKFLGLITNLSSHLLGMSCILLMVVGARSRGYWWIPAAITCYALSVFAKEDFILPPLLLAGYLIWQGRAQSTFHDKGKLGIAMAGLLAMAGAAAAYNFMSSNPFVSGLVSPDAAAYSYAAKLDLPSLARAGWTLTVGYLRAITVLAVASFAVLFVTMPHHRIRLLILALMVGAIIVPYALIPDNMPPFRAYSWSPWFAGAIAIAVTQVCRLAGRNGTLLEWVLAPLLGLAIYASFHAERAGVARWYWSKQLVQANLLDTLDRLRPVLPGGQMVAVAGVEELSPWSNTDGDFLAKLGHARRWVVLVEDTSIFHLVLAPSATGLPADEGVSVVRLDDRCKLPDMPMIRFEPNGTGELERTGDACAGQERAALAVEAWGPQSTRRNTGFNVQAGGASALYFQLSGPLPAEGVSVLWNGRPLKEIVASGSVVTAKVDASLLSEAGEAELVLLIGETRVDAGTFLVTD